MAEVVAEIPQATTEENMDVETEETLQNPNISEENGLEQKPEQNDDSKRSREEQNGAEGASKKQKVEKSVEEERLEKVQESDGNGAEEVEGEEKSVPVTLGPKNFGSSVEMFDYFYKFLRFWPPNLDVNKYEYTVLLDLLKKGHEESDKKVGGGVKAFQVRYHPMWKSRCFFLIREDDSVDDFSFRKCVDHILPLPENIKVNQDANKALGGGGGGRGGRGGGRGGRGGGGGRRGGHSRGRGGWSRN